MKIMFQIEYNHPHQNKLGEEDGSMENIETLSCIDLSTEDGKGLIRDVLNEFLDNYHHDPATAKFWIGGICKTHKE